jgi:glyoxylase-like metal-dependent hydrolase (beta-lactamase superfamily II)
MRVHHLNLLTMCPFGGRLVNGGAAPVLSAGEMVCHALLVETDREGLVLVDTGVGLDDVRAPSKRLGAAFMAFTRPLLAEEATAARQVERLGFSRSDVRHIVLTHLDVDHAGGLPDFPLAKVHLFRKEHEAMTSPRTFNERHRYRPAHFAHHPEWELYDLGGDAWEGFESVRAIADDVHLVPLVGHTRGHSAVAVRAPAPASAGTGWLLHCGDAYFYEGEKATPPSCPPALRAFQRTMAVDDEARRANAARLRQLHAEAGARITMFSAHCPREYRALAAGG